MDAHPEGSDPVSKLGCSPLGGEIEYPPAYASMCRTRRRRRGLKRHCVGGRMLGIEVSPTLALVSSMWTGNPQNQEP